MTTITTYNGITLGFDEISRNSNSEGLTHHLKVKGLDKHQVIGTTSTLTDEQVKELIKDFTFTKGMSGDIWFKCDTLNEFLEVNNIDPSKEYVILKLLNNE